MGAEGGLSEQRQKRGLWTPSWSWWALWGPGRALVSAGRRVAMGVGETKRTRRWEVAGGVVVGCSLSLGEISHDHKGRRNEQRTKADRAEGGRQINRAGEGGEPHSHQTQELLGAEGPFRWKR